MKNKNRTRRTTTPDDERRFSFTDRHRYWDTKSKSLSVVIARNKEQNLSLFIPSSKKGSGLCHACGLARLIHCWNKFSVMKYCNDSHRESVGEEASSMRNNT
jgi:hypothetical protein